jgi:hypothetical protein
LLSRFCACSFLGLIFLKLFLFDHFFQLTTDYFSGEKPHDY